MKLEEVLPALRAGKKVQWALNGWKIETIDSSISLANALAYMHHQACLDDNWSIVEESATDEELAVAFEAMGREFTNINAQAQKRLFLAADMVRKRYVDPSWKPAAKAGRDAHVDLSSILRMHTVVERERGGGK